MKKQILLVAIVLLNINCGNNPVKPQNHNPIILSLNVFPDVIGPKDSAIVICNAFDPDGDTLVYDWITDGRLKIKGGQDEGNFLYNTYENSRIVYPTQYVKVPLDTAWVQCFARDRRGGENAKLVLFIVKQN